MKLIPIINFKKTRKFEQKPQFQVLGKTLSGPKFIEATPSFKPTILGIQINHNDSFIATNQRFKPTK